MFTYTNIIVPLWFRSIQIAVWGLSGTLFCGLEAKIGPKTVKITFFLIFRYPTDKKNKKILGIVFSARFPSLKRSSRKKMELFSCSTPPTRGRAGGGGGGKYVFGRLRNWAREPGS